MHLDSIALKNSAWSEKLWQCPSIWVNTEVAYDPNTLSDVNPPDKEPNVLVNWSLPMSAEAHDALAKRVACDFERATAVINNADKKRQFRKTQVINEKK